MAGGGGCKCLRAMTPRLPFVVLACALLLACGGNSVPRPDGGLATCDPEDERFIPITVVDAASEPVAGAEVTARNEGTGKTIIGTTNDRGQTTAVGSSIGSGTVTLTAQKDTKVSDPAQANFVCGECGCSFEPDSITLRLNP